MNSPQDTQKFRQCLETAEQGDSEAQFYVAFAYDSGVGIQEDKDEAFRWYMKAASQANDKAQLMIGLFYEKGIVVKPNIEEAFKWYLKSAEQGNTTAQNQLGTWYFNKENLNLFSKWWNNNQAFKWFSKAAEQGNPTSQTNIGYCYFYGCGTKKDYAAALEWYMKAAEQNNPDALFQVGYFYENGITVQENSNQALKWYRKAVAQGSSKAQERIDAMSRRIDSNPKTESSSNTNSDGNLNQTTDDNSGCLIAISLITIFIFAIGFSIGLSNTYEGDKKSSNHTTSNVVKDTSNRGPIKIGNLIWSDRSSNGMNWSSAKQYCEDLTEGGYSDWRLPNIDELRTLIQNHPGTQTGGTCKISEKAGKLAWSDRTSDCYGRDGSNFSKLGDTDWLWSSSTLSDYTIYVWLVDFYNGHVLNDDKYDNVDVRCVR
ncbi:SEL1-like repeat protein [bacterium]|nr:SEL1-like repeat protein [bacterium]